VTPGRGGSSLTKRVPRPGREVGGRLFGAHLLANDASAVVPSCLAFAGEGTSAQRRAEVSQPGIDAALACAESPDQRDLLRYQIQAQLPVPTPTTYYHNRPVLHRSEGSRPHSETRVSARGKILDSLPPVQEQRGECPPATERHQHGKVMKARQDTAHSPGAEETRDGRPGFRQVESLASAPQPAAKP
jgi:hypothetical protein